jgi:hypothetical protein
MWPVDPVTGEELTQGELLRQCVVRSRLPRDVKRQMLAFLRAEMLLPAYVVEAYDDAPEGHIDDVVQDLYRTTARDDLED